MVLWLEVTQDKYELPIRVCATVQELSRQTGVTVDGIRSCVFKVEHGKLKRSRFVRVEVESCEGAAVEV